MSFPPLFSFLFLSSLLFISLSIPQFPSLSTPSPLPFFLLTTQPFLSDPKQSNKVGSQHGSVGPWRRPTPSSWPRPLERPPCVCATPLHGVCAHRITPKGLRVLLPGRKKERKVMAPLRARHCEPRINNDIKSSLMHYAAGFTGKCVSAKYMSQIS